MHYIVKFCSGYLKSHVHVLQHCFSFCLVLNAYISILKCCQLFKYTNIYDILSWLFLNRNKCLVLKTSPVKKETWRVISYKCTLNYRLLGMSIMKLFARRAPLRPERKKQKKVGAQSIKGDEVRIIVNIGRATNIPVRLASVVQSGG